jgi:ComF family protein
LWPGHLNRLTVDFFFPARCVGCGRWGNFLCKSCSETSLRIIPPICIKCGRPELNGKLCPTCWDWNNKIDGIRSVFRFDGAIQQAIYEFKYHHLKAIAVDIAEILAAYLKEYPLIGNVLVPVPLHNNRLRQRGYNQSVLITKRLNKVINLPYVIDSLIRIKDSLPQARTSSLEIRRKNVSNAFTCIDNRLRNKQVILIDDVSTSGATLEACAVAIKKAGALSVWGLTIAKEI